MNVEMPGGRLESAADPATVCIGSNEPITIHKDYGPLSFVDVRITAAFETCEWVVERLTIDGDEWVEVARFDGQYEMPDD